MASELREAIKTSAERIAKYVEDVAEMSVETLYVELGAASFDDAKLAARTIVKLDGDSQTVVPMQKGESKLEVDTVIFEVHQQNVSAAIEYRSKMMNSLLSVLRGGSFADEPRSLRSASRLGYRPGFRNLNWGFRCVRGSARQR